MREIRIATAVFFLGLLTLSCSLDYESARIVDSIPDTMPTAELFNFSHTVVRHGQTVFRLSADSARRYDRHDEQHLRRVDFEELGPDGAVIAQGHAEHARVFTESENVELLGEIVFRTEVQEATVRATYLYWDREARMLYGDPNEQVVVEQDDGTRLSGIGFSADLRRQTVEFARDVEGRFVESEER